MMCITTIRAIGIITVLVATISKIDYADGRHCEEQKECDAAAYTDTLLDIAKYGLPRTTEAKHVIIIGAGIAGLTAGKLLKDAGHTVTILEASDRVGGRIFTYRDPDDRYYVDLGAMRIPHEHKFVTTFVEHFNLSTNPYDGYDENTYLYINDIKYRRSEVNENPDILGFNTSPEEKGISADQLAVGATQSVLDECYKYGIWDKTCLTQYDHYNYQEYLVEVGKLSSGAMSMIGIVLGEESYFYHAFTELLWWHVHRTFYEITGGTDSLPNAFLPSLEDNIVYNARVSRIEHGNGTVVAHYPSLGRDVSVSGDYLLTTATATSTSFIQFIPGLDSEKRAAIRNIHYSAAHKIVLVFQKPFWKDEGIHGGNTLTDLPSTLIYYKSHDFESGLGVMLASYVGSDKSAKFQGLTDEQCISQALNDVAEIHGEHIRELYVEGIVKQWGLDPYSLGAWVEFKPYQLTNLQPHVARPVGNLYFAGEYTNSPPHGFMEPAVRSAVEAANCISTGYCYPDLERNRGTGPHFIACLPLLSLMYSLFCW